MTNKQKILDFIQRLPDDVTIDRTIDGLCLLRKIDIGLAQVESGDVITHEELKRRFRAKGR